jgi:hypothetical protein
MGKLAQKVSELTAPQFGLPCGVTKVLSVMDEVDKNTLELILFPQSDKEKRISNRQIKELLISEGYDIAQSSLALHRRKQCRCFTGINARIEALGNQ